MPLPLASLSLFMPLLNLVLIWVPYLLVLSAGIEFYGHILKSRAGSTRRMAKSDAHCAARVVLVAGTEVYGIPLEYPRVGSENLHEVRHGVVMYQAHEYKSLKNCWHSWSPERQCKVPGPDGYTAT